MSKRFVRFFKHGTLGSLLCRLFALFFIFVSGDRFLLHPSHYVVYPFLPSMVCPSLVLHCSFCFFVLLSYSFLFHFLRSVLECSPLHFLKRLQFKPSSSFRFFSIFIFTCTVESATASLSFLIVFLLSDFLCCLIYCFVIFLFHRLFFPCQYILRFLQPFLNTLLCLISFLYFYLVFLCSYSIFASSRFRPFFLSLIIRLNKVFLRPLLISSLDVRWFFVNSLGLNSGYQLRTFSSLNLGTFTSIFYLNQVDCLL